MRVIFLIICSLLLISSCSDNDNPIAPKTDSNLNLKIERLSTLLASPGDTIKIYTNQARVPSVQPIIKIGTYHLNFLASIKMNDKVIFRAILPSKSKSDYISVTLADTTAYSADKLEIIETVKQDTLNYTLDKYIQDLCNKAIIKGTNLLSLKGLIKVYLNGKEAKIMNLSDSTMTIDKSAIGDVFQYYLTITYKDSIIYQSTYGHAMIHFEASPVYTSGENAKLNIDFSASSYHFPAKVESMSLKIGGQYVKILNWNLFVTGVSDLHLTFDFIVPEFDSGYVELFVNCSLWGRSNKPSINSSSRYRFSNVKIDANFNANYTESFIRSNNDTISTKEIATNGNGKVGTSEGANSSFSVNLDTLIISKIYHHSDSNPNDYHSYFQYYTQIFKIYIEKNAKLTGSYSFNDHFEEGRKMGIQYTTQTEYKFKNIELVSSNDKEDIYEIPANQFDEKLFFKYLYIYLPNYDKGNSSTNTSFKSYALQPNDYFRIILKK